MTSSQFLPGGAGFVPCSPLLRCLRQSAISPHSEVQPSKCLALFSSASWPIWNPTQLQLSPKTQRHPQCLPCWVLMQCPEAPHTDSILVEVGLIGREQRASPTACGLPALGHRLTRQPGLWNQPANARFWNPLQKCHFWKMAPNCYGPVVPHNRIQQSFLPISLG